MRNAALPLALLVVLAGVLPAVALAAPTAAASTAGGDVARSVSPLEHETEIVVNLRADTAAEWVVETRYSLETENETAAFETYARQFEANETSAGYDVALFERAADRAEEVANREMRIVNTTREATVENGTGVLRLTFVWTDFLNEDGSRLVLSDALRVPGNRTWLRSLAPGQQLVVRTPAGYTIDSTNFPILPRNGSIIVNGPREVGDQSPIRVVYAEQQSEEPDPASTPWELIVGGLVVVALVVGGVLLFQRRDGDLVGGAGAAGDGGPPSTGGGDPPDQTAAGDGPTGAVDGASGDADAAAGPESEESEPAVDLSLLSDEERVEHLLEQNGGRMKQANIVRETGWSDAKVSQLLSSMADEERVNKLRLGRENLISLPDEADSGDEAET